MVLSSKYSCELIDWQSTDCQIQFAPHFEMIWSRRIWFAYSFELESNWIWTWSEQETTKRYRKVVSFFFTKITLQIRIEFYDVRWCCLSLSIKHIICIALDYRGWNCKLFAFSENTAYESIPSISWNDNIPLAICLQYLFSNLQFVFVCFYHRTVLWVTVIILFRLCVFLALRLLSRDRRHTVVKLLFSFAIIGSCWLSQFQVMPKQIFAHKHKHMPTPKHNDMSWVPFFPHFHSFTLYERINDLFAESNETCFFSEASNGYCRKSVIK